MVLETAERSDVTAATTLISSILAELITHLRAERISDVVRQRAASSADSLYKLVAASHQTQMAAISKGA